MFRSFGGFVEALAAKKLFGSLTDTFNLQKKDLEGIGQIKIEIYNSETSEVEILYWSPSANDSLEAYMKSLPHIQGKYNVSTMEAEFDLDHQRVKVVSPDNFKKYLEIPRENRGSLRVHMTKAGGDKDETTFAKALRHHFGEMSEQLSERLRKWCVKKFSSSSVTDDEVDKSMEKLQKAGVDFQSAESKGNGNIKEFVGIQGDKMQDLIDTLVSENAPQTVVSAMKRGLLMKKNSEGVYGYTLDGGLLKTLYVVQILTLRKANNEYDMLIAWFELSLGKPIKAEGSGGLEAALSLSQLSALSDYAETKATNHWKKQSLRLLQADKGDDDDDIE
eukprot:Skav205589  [mRNA]  locus=scaffold460:111066:112064:+ [translate_table: standard]